MNNFDDFKLQPKINDALKAKGYTKPTLIQEQAIPHLLLGSDLLGIAQTGTGKTAAFSLPIIHRLAAKPFRVLPKCMRVLILTPTRELASQIELNIKSYSKGLNLRSKVIFGGVGPTPQVNALKQGLEFVIATPGRLLDLMQEGHVNFSQLEVFVLDEADRMLDMGFIHDIKKIIQKLPPKRQTLLFSATMPPDIEKLAQGLLKNPIKVEVTPESSTIEKIKQSVCFLTKDNKIKLLAEILRDENLASALVFTRTKHGADKVVRMLEKEKLLAKAIHGNKSQNNRESALKRFREGEVKILVATDIAARGIDVDHITHVINYNLPEDATNYVHRIGRTARAGREGIAISLCDGHEISLLQSIEKHIKMKITPNTDQPYHEESRVLIEKAGKKVTRNDRGQSRKASTASPKKKLSQSKKARRRRSFKG